MPAPGSSHALVLPSSSTTVDEPTPPGERAVELLQPFLDPTKYTAVAVVHGLGASAPRAFDLAKQRLANGRGLIWVTDPDLVPDLTGENAATWKKLLKPVDGFVMTFFSVESRKVTGKLEWFRLNLAEIDERYLKTGLS